MIQLLLLFLASFAGVLLLIIILLSGRKIMSHAKKVSQKASGLKLSRSNLWNLCRGFALVIVAILIVVFICWYFFWRKEVEIITYLQLENHADICRMQDAIDEPRTVIMREWETHTFYVRAGQQRCYYSADEDVHIQIIRKDRGRRHRVSIRF